MTVFFNRENGGRKSSSERTYLLKTLATSWGQFGVIRFHCRILKHFNVLNLSLTPKT